MRPLVIIAALGTAGGMLAACAAPVVPGPASTPGTAPQTVAAQTKPLQIGRAHV